MNNSKSIPAKKFSEEKQAAWNTVKTEVAYAGLKKLAEYSFTVHGEEQLQCLDYLSNVGACLNPDRNMVLENNVPKIDSFGKKLYKVKVINVNLQSICKDRDVFDCYSIGRAVKRMLNEGS